MPHDPSDSSSDTPEVTESVTFADWQIQLKLACEADRRDDIEAIASLRPPRQVVLRHVTVTRERARVISASEDGMLLSGGARKTTNRDELIPYEVMTRREPNDCPPLPEFPEPGSPEAAELRNHLLREPNQFSGSCLFWARSLEAVRLLEANGADTRDTGWMGIPLLVFMAEAGRLDVVRFLIEERGHDPNVAREDGAYTALHWAKGLETVRYLLERGGDANALTASGDSVLAQQLRSGQADVVDHLLGLGEERASRANLLHWLAAKPNIVRVLCRHRVPLDTLIESTFMERSDPRVLHRVLMSGIEIWEPLSDPQEKTAAADAVVESVDILLENGCDPLLRNGGGRLPYQVVRELLPDSAEPLRQSLDERLARYGEPPDPLRNVLGRVWDRLRRRG